MYGKKYMGVERTTVVIDATGKVAKVFEKVKPAGHAAEVMAVDDPWIKSYFASRHTVQSASAPGRQAPRDGA